MKQVRQSAFETNSSSSHSITIAEGDFKPDTLYIEDGVLEIHPGEYGWEHETYYDAATKASYCLTWLKGEDARHSEEDEEMFIKVLKEVTGAREVKFVPVFTEETKSQSDFWQWGYIDHQSGPGEGGALSQAWRSEEALKSFIFNPASRLHTDNDNDPCSECEYDWRRDDIMDSARNEKD